jgi:folate-binding protein YgfZ
MNVASPSTGVPERAWTALRQGAIVVDRSDRLRMTFSGAKAAESLNGLVTNEVVSLTPGHGQYAAALTPKGKIIADVRIFAREDGLLVDVNAAAAPGWAGMIRKFVNPRLARYQDVTAETGDIGVFGASAAAIVRLALGAHVTDLPPYAHITVMRGEASLLVVRVPDFGVDGYDIIGPRAAMTDVRTTLIEAGAIDDATEALEAARIEAGRPVWGIDMDDTMLAQELDMERLEAISFTKGCYTGQETVARVHFRGHVNRFLRGLRFSDAIVPPAGTPLTDAEDKEIGVVKSGALPPGGGAIALAILRREIEPGSTVRAKWPGSSGEARVESLPIVLDG